MASNPMQKKARNSFLLGMFITMIIAAAVIGFLLYQMKLKQDEEEEIELAKKSVYVLAQDVTAGSTVALKDDSGKILLTLTEVDSTIAPTTIIALTDITENSLFKVDLAAGTILTSDLIVEAEDVTSDDTREQEFNMVILPTYLAADDYIDIRLRLPSGEDYVVVSKKKVIDTDEETVWLNLGEDEILTLANAIVEAYQIAGSLLYANTYVEPGLQVAATVTYVPSDSVIKLIAADPNVVEEAKSALADRYNIATLKEQRQNIIDAAIVAGAEDAQSNVASGVDTSIETQKESRSNYLTELEAAASAETTSTTTTK